jgi:hypothetical protein
MCTFLDAATKVGCTKHQQAMKITSITVFMIVAVMPYEAYVIRGIRLGEWDLVNFAHACIKALTN